MTLNRVAAVILRYLTPNLTAIIHTYVHVVNVDHILTATKTEPKYFMVTFSEISEKQCVTEKYPRSKTKIRVVQHCTRGHLINS